MKNSYFLNKWSFCLLALSFLTILQVKALEGEKKEEIFSQKHIGSRRKLQAAKFEAFRYR